MKIFVFALCLLIMCGSAQAHATVWKPAPGHTQIPIWPSMPPDAKPMPGSETVTLSKDLVAGHTVTEVTNVAKPTITVYSPKGKNTGAAVVVFPGGGFMILAMDLEGTEPCQWLTSIGVTCVLLKYRVPSAPDDWHCNCYPKGADVVSVPALQDAQRAIRLVRYNASKWHIDPHKVGVMGFSAGGYLVAETSADFDKPSYKPIDAVDKKNDRPDFAVATYPGHMIVWNHRSLLNPNIHFTRKTPPTFILQAEDAKTDPWPESLDYYRALAKVGVPAELHFYAKGGHAFGLRPTKLPITHWPRLVGTWLHTVGMIPAVPHSCEDGSTLAHNCLTGYGVDR